MPAKTQGRIANQLCRPRQDLRGRPHLLSLERIWYYIKGLTECQYFNINFLSQFPQRKGARFIRRRRMKKVKSFSPRRVRGENTLTQPPGAAFTSPQTGEGESTAQPLAALLLYGCGVPLAGKGGRRPLFNQDGTPCRCTSSTSGRFRRGTGRCAPP